MSHRLSPLSPGWLLLPLGLLYLLSLVRLVQLQVSPPPARVQEVYERIDRTEQVDVPWAPILDRDGRPLAQSRPAWRLLLDSPLEYRKFRESTMSAPLARVAAVLDGVPVEELRSLLLDERPLSVIAGGLSQGTALRLQALLPKLRGTGLVLERYWVRSYPQGRALAHLVGYVDPPALRAPLVGRAGLEKIAAGLLEGTPGCRRSLAVARGYGVNPAFDATPPQLAAPLRTTLDGWVGVQVRSALVELAGEWRAESASAVVLDARNGEILAMSSWPDFDPHRPGAGAGATGDVPGLGFPALWALDPGSTFKPFVVARALDAGLLRASETFTQGENDTWWFKGRALHNVREVPDHPLTWREILLHSSNIGAAQIGLRLGAEGLKELIADFGLHEKDALPWPQSALVAPSEAAWRKEQWAVVSVSFGRDLTLTPLRLAAAHAALVNGGTLHQPRLHDHQELPPPRRVVSVATSARIREALRAVVEKESRRQLHDPEMRWGGKSGTVDVFNNGTRYRAVFVGFAPAEEPRYVVLVVSEAPQGHMPYGSRVCGPAVKRLLRALLERDGLLAPRPLDGPVGPGIVRAD